MLFEKKPPINLITCPRCQATGILSWGKCPNCKGMAMGYGIRGKFLYWAFPLTRFHLDLERGRRILAKIRFGVFLALGLNFWIWLGFWIYRTHLYLQLPNGNLGAFWQGMTGVMRTFLWLGLICFAYLYYRSIREREFAGIVEHYNYEGSKRAEGEDRAVAANSWEAARKINRRRRHNIAEAFTGEARKVLEDAYRLADKVGASAVEPLHLFYAMLVSNRISNIFIRLGITMDMFKNRLPPLVTGQKRDKLAMPLISADLAQVIFQAYEEAYNAHQEYVSVTELLEATVNSSPTLQEVLYDIGVEKQKLINVVEWARIRERLHRQYVKLRVASSHRSKYGMDKAMTAVATPFLNQFSDDLTLLAQFGRTETCVAREKEMEEIFRIAEGGQQNVILVGDYGVGKRSVVEGIAERMVEDDVPARLNDKRMVRLSVSALLAGTTPSGAVERLMHMMNEISRAGNIILFIHNIHELVGVSAGSEGKSLDVADTLSEFLSNGRFMTIATTTTEAHGKYIVNSPLGNVFAPVEIREMDENQAIQVLESKVGHVEYKQNVFFSYEEIEKAVQLSQRFIHDNYLPGSALEIMSEAASYAHNKKGANSLVTGEEVAAVVAAKTKIPVTTVSSDETSKLLKLEEEMHKRVVGQDEAVDLVANALRRARAEIRSAKKPIANFLFLGPTGVGKTELAKTIAEVYFGGEERMIRLDMSEYQDKQSIYRLIGAPGEKGSGILTEAVRRNSFALVLLDEIEKADKDILNLFLQVMDDGRLTDSSGRVVDFTNVILIATSNAGTAYVGEQMRAGLSSEAIKERLLHGELKEYFRPEFLNRFDGIVLFKSLTRDDIKKIAGFMFKRIAKDLEVKGIDLKVDDAALEFLAEVGFDPEFGARPMRRALQERVENKLAELVLGGKLRRRDTIIIGAGGAITVAKS